MILTYGLFVLIISTFVITGFDANVFAEEIIIQKNSSSGDANRPEPMIKTQTVSSDGSIWIFLTTTEPAEKKRMTLNVGFTDEDGKQAYNINYDIMATQNGKVVLEDLLVNHQIGIGDHRTQMLLSDDDVHIKITLQGIGADPPFTGPHGEFIQIEEVPRIWGNIHNDSNCCNSQYNWHFGKIQIDDTLDMENILISKLNYMEKGFCEKGHYCVCCNIVTVSCFCRTSF